MKYVKRKIKGLALDSVCFVVGVGVVLTVAALPYIVKDNG